MTAKKTFPAPIKLLPRRGTEPAAGASGEPFVRMLGGAHPLRAYLACLQVDGQVVVPHLAVLMEPNEYPGAGASGGRAVMNNRQLERIWRRGFARQRSQESRWIAGVDERALPADLAAGDVPHHPPLAWCEKTGAYATPLCPHCLGAMATCRDETLLRRSGLPSYEDGLTRFLHCPACAGDEKRPRVFYTYSLQKVDGLPDNVRVRHRSELYRDLGPRISSADASVGDASELHACFACEHRATCYPAGRQVTDRLPAEEHLHPLAYYDFHWIPIDALPLDFHAVVALLGGASPADLDPPPAAVAAGDTLRLTTLAELSRPGRQFLFEGDTSGLFPLESLYLKLAAVADLARGAEALVAETGSAHLALTPDRLRGRVTVGPDILPVRWGMSLRIADLLTTAPPAELEADHVDGEPRVDCLPHPCPEAFLPEGMCRPQIEQLTMRLAREDLQVETSGGQRRATIRARLTARDLYRAGEHGDHDLVRLVLVVGAAGDQRVVFSGRKVDSVTGGFVFAGATGPLTETVAAALESADLPPSSSVSVTVAHVFAAPADVMSLGLVMLRLLLTNDRQDTGRLDSTEVASLAATVAGDAAAEPGGESARLHAAFQEAGIVSGVREVLYREIDRTASDAAIPAGLWEDTLLLALRMASNVPGWSICGAQDDYDPEDPAGPLRIVVGELTEVMERARGSLIGSVGRNASVQEVCDDFLADLEEAARPESAVASGDAMDRTIVAPAKGRSR